MLSYIYCYFYFCLLIRAPILGTANAATFDYLLVRIYLVQQMLSYIYCYFCLLYWYGKCFHIYTATFIYLVVRVYLVRQMLSYIYCYFLFIYILLLLTDSRAWYTWYGKLGTANAFIYILLFLFTFCLLLSYILLLLFTDWYAYTWYGKWFSYI